MNALPPVEGLLPHGQDAVLLTRLSRHDGDWLEAAAAVPARSPYAGEAWASAALIEAAAQAVGAHVAIAAAGGHENRPVQRPPGYLVGIKNARLAAHLPLDVELRVCVRRTGGSGPLAIYAAEVYHADHELLHAELSVWTPPAEASK